MNKCSTGCAVPVKCDIKLLTECGGEELTVPCAVDGSDVWTMLDGEPKKSEITMDGCDDITVYGDGRKYSEKKHTYLMCIEDPDQVKFQEALEGIEVGDGFIIKRECEMPDGTKVVKYRPYYNGGLSEAQQGDSNGRVFGFDWVFTPRAMATDECPEC